MINQDEYMMNGKIMFQYFFAGKFPVYVFSNWPTLREKCPNTEYLSTFSPNAGKYGLQKTPYLDIFHAVRSLH